MCKEERIIFHHLESENTVVYWITRHKLLQKQRKTIKVLHGNCKIKRLDIRFKNEDEFIKFFLNLRQKQATAAIYFVSPSSWKEKLLDKYLEKINGTVFGWFIGFGKSDIYSSIDQELFYRYKGTWLKFPVALNFGKTIINQNKIKKHFHK